jgi:hypothetical protein
VSLSDIWEALGAEWCYTMDNKDYVLSNLSMIMCADLLCIYNINEQPEVDPRTQMIGKLLPKAVLKSGVVNLNPLNAWDGSKQLATFTMDSDVVTLQNDSTHAADEGKAPNPM